MAGLLVLGGGILAGEVVAVPLGGYVYSNYISKQKTWTAWTIGAVGTGVLFPVITFYAVQAYGDYKNKQDTQKIAKDIEQKRMGIQNPK
jgi:uncharacterized membrane protein